VFTARYALSPYIKQIRSVFKGLNQPGVTVWGALSSEGVLGPVFFDGNSYLNMLRDVVVPQLRTGQIRWAVLPARWGNSSLCVVCKELPWQHHLTALDRTTRQHWLAATFTRPYPNGLHFRGVVKNTVYERKPQTVDEMKEFITDAFMDTDSDRKLCRTVCQSVSDRLDACCNVDGGHFEHLRD
jgi:hypothetical protein